MTVTTTTNVVSYPGNGSTQTFAYTFKIFNDSDLVVKLVDDTSKVETLQVLTTDYTVTNAGNVNGGNVVFVVAPASGKTVLIQREVPFTQETDYVANDPFPAESHESALDKLTILAQQVNANDDTSLKIPDSDLAISPQPTRTIPSATSRANGLLSFDGNGNVTTVPLSTSTTETTLTKQDFTGTGSQVSFTLSTTPDAAGVGLMIFIDGVYQERGPSNYTISGDVITFQEAPPLNSTIQVLNFTLKDLGVITANASAITQNHANDGSTPAARRLGGDVQSALEFIYDNVFEPAKVTFTSIYPFKIEPTNGGSLLINTDTFGVSNNSVRVDLKTGLTNAFNFRQSGAPYLTFNTASEQVELDKPLYVKNGATFATGGVQFSSGVSVGVQDVLSVTGRTAFSGDTQSRGDGFTAAGSLHKTSIMRHGDIIITRIFVDITGLQSGAAGNTIIGGFGLANSHIGSISPALMGTIFYSTIRCVESATGGDTNIDLYESSDGTQSQGAVITGTPLNTSLTAVAGNSAITGNPTETLYLVGAGSTSTAYNSGQFLIEMYAYA